MKNPIWRTKLTGLFVAVLVASLLLQVLYVIPYTQDREVEHSEVHQERVAHNIAHELDIGLNNLVSSLTSIAKLAEFRNMDISNQTKTMNQYTAISPNINSLFVLNDTGWFISGTTTNISVFQMKSYALMNYFISAFEHGETYYATPRAYFNDTIISTSVSVPIESDTGERVGVLMGTLWLNDLISNVVTYPLEEDQRAYLVDNEGMVVAHSEIDLFALEDGPLSLNYSSRHLVNEIIINVHLNWTEKYDQNGTTYIGTNVRLESNGWGVVVETERDTILSQSDELAGRLWLFNGVLFVIVLGITVIFTQQITAEQRRSEEELKRHRDTLEEVVDERTAELRESEENVRLMVSEVKDYAIIMLDPEGKIVNWNEGAQYIEGYTSEEIVGEHFSRFYSKEDIESGKPEEELKISAEVGRYEDEGWRVRKDGSKFWANVVMTALRNPEGKLIGFSKVTRDMTESKKAMEKIERLAKFPSENPNPVLRIAKDGTILYNNEASISLLKSWDYKEGEPISGDWYKIVLDALKTAESQWKEAHCEERIFSLTYAPVVDSSYVNVYALDITERKKLEEEKMAMEAQLRQSQKLESIGTLASGVAHEINNPLMGMISYAEIITSRVQDKSLKEFADGIMEEGNRVAHIVKNLLSFARQDKESHSPADINDIIESPLSLIATTFKKDQITIVKDIPEDLPKIKCRSQQIQQVMMNLLTNARDALNQKYEGFHEDKLINLKVRPFERDGIKWMRITIEDHGTGMPPEVLNRIFDPFFTTKSRAKGKGVGGTGLGLSVSYGIINEHLGELSVESKLGEYNRFLVDLRVNNGWTMKTSSENDDDNHDELRDEDVSNNPGINGDNAKQYIEENDEERSN